MPMTSRTARSIVGRAKLCDAILSTARIHEPLSPRRGTRGWAALVISAAELSRCASCSQVVGWLSLMSSSSVVKPHLI